MCNCVCEAVQQAGRQAERGRNDTLGGLATELGGGAESLIHSLKYLKYFTATPSGQIMCMLFSMQQES